MCKKHNNCLAAAKRCLKKSKSCSEIGLCRLKDELEAKKAELAQAQRQQIEIVVLRVNAAV